MGWHSKLCDILGLVRIIGIPLLRLNFFLPPPRVIQGAFQDVIQDAIQDDIQITSRNATLDAI